MVDDDALVKTNSIQQVLTLCKVEVEEVYCVLQLRIILEYSSQMLFRELMVFQAEFLECIEQSFVDLRCRNFYRFK